MYQSIQKSIQKRVDPQRHSRNHYPRFRNKKEHKSLIFFYTNIKICITVRGSSIIQKVLLLLLLLSSSSIGDEWFVKYTWDITLEILLTHLLNKRDKYLVHTSQIRGTISSVLIIYNLGPSLETITFDMYLRLLTYLIVHYIRYKSKFRYLGLRT